MKVRMTFIWPGYAEGPELALAWDEYAIDENDVGWHEAREKEIDLCGSELRPEMVRDVEIEVDYDVITRLFYPTELDASAVQDVTEQQAGGAD